MPDIRENYNKVLRYNLIFQKVRSSTEWWRRKLPKSFSSIAALALDC